MDTIVGTAGVDSISTTATTGAVQALGGNDFIYIGTSNGAAQSIDAGDGDDNIQIQLSRDAAPTNITLTLGLGRDTLKIFQIQQAVTVTDFKTGAQGDVVDFRYTLDQWVNGWDGHTNPFSAGNPYFRLVQVGVNTVLQIDKHDFGQAGTWTDWMVFQNTAVQNFTAENFGGAAPDGSVAPNLVLQGASGDDTLNDGYGNDQLYGGAGDDTLLAGPGDDILVGGDGGDNLKDEYGGNDRLLGGAGNDYLEARAISTTPGPTGRAAYMDGGTGDDSLVYSARPDTAAVFTGLGGSGDDSISFGGTTTATVDAGAGTDRVFFDRSGASTITLGEGSDVAVAYIPKDRQYGAGAHAIHITDFETGLAGDRVDVLSYVDFLGWNGQSDLVANNYLRLEQVGANTVISIAPNGGGAWNTTVILDNVQLAALTAFNLTGLHPNGAYNGVVKNVSSGAFAGGDGDDLLMGSFGNVTLNGGNGGDRLEGSGSSDVLRGDDGADILIGGGAIDQLFGGAGADLLIGGSGADQLQGGAGADRFEGTRADLAGDVILDLQRGDSIRITDADAAHFSFTRAGSTITLSTGESLRLANDPRNDIVAVASGQGGVLLKLADTPKVVAATTFNADFNGDGLGDLAWRDAGGIFTTSTARLNQGHLAMNANVFTTNGVDNSWRLATADDFNGDGKSDLMWRGPGGVFSLWTSTGSGFAPNTLVDASVSSDWSLAATGDFNGDGKADLVWRHSSGAFSEWNSNGSGFQKNVYVQGGVDPSWQLAGVGDFNGDGRDDMVWRHAAGTFSIWESTGAGFTPNAVVDSSVSAGWGLAAVGDFNGDGKDDLLWRDEGGTFTEWRSTGQGFEKNVYVNGQVGADWALEGVGDFNGDGKADLMWRHEGGAFTIWTSTGDGFALNTLTDSSMSSNWALASADYFLA